MGTAIKDEGTDRGSNCVLEGACCGIYCGERTSVVVSVLAGGGVGA